MMFSYNDTRHGYVMLCHQYGVYIEANVYSDLLTYTLVFR